MLAFASDVLSAPPVPVPVELTGLPDRVRLVPAGGPAGYHAERPVHLQVRSQLPEWRLVLVTSPLKGPGGAVIPSSALRIRLVGRQGAQGADVISLAEPVVIGQGRTNRGNGVEVVHFFVEAETAADQAFGDYSGTFEFIFDFGASHPPIPAGRVPVVLELSESLQIHVGGGNLDFGSVQPGEVFPKGDPVCVTVVTNKPSGEIVLTLDRIRAEGGARGFIPSSRVALGIGPTREAARTAAAENRLGTDTLRWRIPGPGTHQFHLDGRIVVSYEDAPGRYRGLVTITAGGF